MLDIEIAPEQKTTRKGNAEAGFDFRAELFFIILFV
jgi:hypothetical protein